MGSLGYLGATGRASASRVVERRQIARPADSGLRASGGGGVTPLTVRGDGSRCSGRSESWRLRAVLATRGRRNSHGG